MNKPGIEYKQIALEIKQFGDDTEDDSFHFFEGLASTFGNKDFGDDIVVKGAFVETLKKITPTILWQHDMRDPIGMPMQLEENKEGLFVKARMPKEDSLVSGRVAPQMRVGSIKSMSIGFSVDEFEIKDGVRFIQKLTLWEISLVTLPMNTKAAVTDFKMESEPPFKKSGLDITELEIMDVKGIEKYLRGLEIMSKSACIAMASRFVKGRSESDNDNRSESGSELMLEELKKLNQTLKQ